MVSAAASLTVGAALLGASPASAGWSTFKAASDMGPKPNRLQLSHAGRGFWAGSDHWTGSRWIKTQLPGFETKVDAVSWTAPVPGSSSVWGIAQTGGGAPVSVLAIYGALP
jgi:hypothetical protein